MTRTMTTTTEKTPGMADYEKRIREALGRELTGEKWESDGAGVYSVEDSDFEVAVCFTQDADDAAYIAACDPSAIRALLAELDAVRGALLKIANDCDTGEHTDIARTTLAQQAQEPVAWLNPETCDVMTDARKTLWLSHKGGYEILATKYTQALYTTPQPQPAPQAGEVTDEQIDALIKKHARNLYSSSQLDWEVAEFHRFGLLQLIHAILALRPQAVPMALPQVEGDVLPPMLTAPKQLALRPHAVPMTPEQIKAISQAAFHVVRSMPDDEVNGDTWDIVFASAVEAHHGITAQGAQGEQA